MDNIATDSDLTDDFNNLYMKDTEPIKALNPQKKSRFNNTYKCLICNSEFRCRSLLKNHIMRTEKCGLITNDDMIDDIKKEFAEFLDEFEAIPKAKENLKELNTVYIKLRKRYNAIANYSEFNNKEALMEAKKQLQTMKDEITSIVTYNYVNGKKML
jgi:predicted nuclease with TOPRIM domain